MKIRIKIVYISFVAAFLLLVVRLLYWQIYKGGELAIAARSQYEGEQIFNAERGDILASDGTWLAASVKAWQVHADLAKIDENHGKIADTLAPLFVDNRQDKEKLLAEADRLKTQLNKDDVVWVLLKNKIDDATKKTIETLNIAGIGFDPKETRVYPEASAAAQLLGFVGKNSDGVDQGYFGLEGFYDFTLTGKPGFLSRQEDASGNPILIGSQKEILATGGVDLVTTIDKSIQLIIEKKLVEGIQKYSASGGTAIVMNPQTGAILAMSSYPSYDPATYYNYGNEYFINPAVSLSFEPGSVFKVVVMASALDAGVITPDTKCEICDGPHKIDKYSIETWNQQYFPNSTMTDVIVHSDNVGMTFVSQKMGIDPLYDYLTRFGIGQPTDVDLQGELDPKLRDKKLWGVVDLATASFGQGVAVTPLQLIRAVSAIANKGVLVAPYVVQKIEKDGWEQDIIPSGNYKGTRVISEKSASEATAMMVAAAEYGEAKWTYKKGFGVAGKTGTAQIPIEGHYDAEKTIASFVGFAPFDNPKFIMLITLKEPQSSPWASETAAPMWYSIADDLFLYFGMQPKN